MPATMNLTAFSSDLVGYLDIWTANFGYNSNGAFSPASNPHEQWVAGNVGVDSSAVLLEGSFSYASPGGFTGTLDTLDFGWSATGSASSGFALTATDLSIDLGGAAPTAAFNQAIYMLSHGGNLTGGTVFGQSFDGLYDYFGDVGTVQNGTSSDDRLYSFDGNDDLNGGAGRDTFVFDRDIAGSLASSIGNDSVSGFVAGATGDFIDLSGLASTSFDTYAEVFAASSQVGADTVINLGSLGTITLESVSKSALTSGNFVF